MDGVLFEEWARELDQQFSSEGRGVALVIDNCLEHPHIKNLKLIDQIVFLTAKHHINNTAYKSMCNKIIESRIS